MSHTPGPWHCHYVADIAEETESLWQLATGITTSSIDEFNKEGDRGDLIAWVPHDRNEEANAALISAAPELLAALKKCVFALNVKAKFRAGDSDSYAIAAQADLAINKAEGRTA
jgi:hypothetical protein